MAENPDGPNGKLFVFTTAFEASSDAVMILGRKNPIVDQLRTCPLEVEIR
jgi:hypothetical protein